MTEKRIAELREIASRISEMDPEKIHMESADWMEKRGCRNMKEIYLVRNVVLDRMVYGRRESHENA